MVSSFRRKGLRAWALVVLPAMLAARDARADDAADALLRDVINAYKTLPGYSDRGELLATVEADGKATETRSPFWTAFQRPNFVEINAQFLRIVCDGKDQTAYVKPKRRYVRSKIPTSIPPFWVDEPAWAAIYEGNFGLPPLVVLTLLAHDDPVGAVKEGTYGIKVLDDAPKEKGGKPLRRLFVDQKEGPDIVLWTDPATHLLERVELQIRPVDLPIDLAEAKKVTKVAFYWEPGQVVLTPGPFDPNPPPDYVQVNSFDAAILKDNASAADSGPVGRPAPEFSALALDPDGKTHRLGKADLAGKVAVIGFWAAWSPPSVAGLGELRGLARSYEPGDGVAFVALNQDEAPKGLAALRGTIEAVFREAELDGGAPGAPWPPTRGTRWARRSGSRRCRRSWSSIGEGSSAPCIPAPARSSPWPSAATST